MPTEISLDYVAWLPFRFLNGAVNNIFDEEGSFGHVSEEEDGDENSFQAKYGNMLDWMVYHHIWLSLWKIFSDIICLQETKKPSIHIAFIKLFCPPSFDDLIRRMTDRNSQGRNIHEMLEFNNAISDWGLEELMSNLIIASVFGHLGRIQRSLSYGGIKTLKCFSAHIPMFIYNVPLFYYFGFFDLKISELLDEPSIAVIEKTQRQVLIPILLLHLYFPLVFYLSLISFA
ncbi:hypothetical protein ACJX0J_028589 [Zea mays]